MRQGITQFDASSGGLGGCPYALGASGNQAMETGQQVIFITERAVFALRAKGLVLAPNPDSNFYQNIKAILFSLLMRKNGGFWEWCFYFVFMASFFSA